MDSAQDGIAVMLHKCGVSEALIGRLRSDEAFAYRIAEFVKLAAVHPAIAVRPVSAVSEAWSSCSEHLDSMEELRRRGP